MTRFFDIRIPAKCRVELEDGQLAGGYESKSLEEGLVYKLGLRHTRNSAIVLPKADFFGHFALVEQPGGWQSAIRIKVAVGINSSDNPAIRPRRADHLHQ